MKTMVASASISIKRGPDVLGDSDETLNKYYRMLKWKSKSTLALALFAHLFEKKIIQLMNWRYCFKEHLRLNCEKQLPGR